ncbi:uncharacterized protein isoform X1 [Musca autumnalis]|uniref:uncharacterized protein isoform X1 n=2 Tax=Musca autumnalis TaxID=221902 RepID=UPI003CEA6C08
MEDVKDQTSVVLDVLAENTTAIKHNLKNSCPTFSKKFPIKNVDQFNSMEKSIDESNEKEYIASVRSICGNKGIRKTISEFIEPELLCQFNLDGSHNKLRLLNFPKIMGILFAGTYVEGCTDKTFKEEIRVGMRLAKNRYCKEKMKSKKLSCDKKSTDESTAVLDVADDVFQSQCRIFINS